METTLADDSQVSTSTVLRDGTAVTVRPIRLEDALGLQGLFKHLSPRSAFFRFLTCWKELSPERADYMARVDCCSRMAYVATLVDSIGERIVGLATYACLEPSEEGVAEASVVVDDEYQGLGLGTALLQRLAVHARRCGVETFVGTVHSDNAPMLQWLEHSGLSAAITAPANGASDLQVTVALPAAPNG